MENKYSKTPLSRFEILKAIAFKNVMERKKEKNRTVNSGNCCTTTIFSKQFTKT
ncbi:hypothetical protein [Flavobacterium sp.]|uniref:hypothetical protein n=1 Tax=Flavobacterium sp. TaxID=239 RepID=UPI002FDE6310